MRVTLVLVALALAGCNGADTQDDQNTSAELVPERILFRDIEENVMVGASCAFAPSDGGSAATAIAMPVAGFIKLDGAIVELPAVADDQQLGPPSLEYEGTDYALSLTLDAASERSREDGGREFDAQLEVRKADGTTVYEAEGLAQCGAPAETGSEAEPEST